jgi:hypothetical protein
VPATPLPPPHVSDAPPPAAAPMPDSAPQIAVPIPSRPH